MNSFGLSDKGKYRAENQDAFRIEYVDDAILAVVCDGMGGVAGGRLASETAVERFISFALSGLKATGGTACDDVLREAADAANREVYHLSQLSEEYSGMGTTLVAGIFRRDEAVLVNVGDSRAYRVARDGIVQLTKDHSLVQQMVDSGQLTPAQAKKHPRRNIITRAVGSEPFVTSDIFELPVRQGDMFLLCSDGLTNAVEEAELHRLILAADDDESGCRSLVEAALANHARDNITAVVINPTMGGGILG